MCENQMLTIMLDTKVKDDAVDIILGLDEITGFTLSQAGGFSRKHAKYSIKEQVEGYRDFYRMDVIHKPGELQKILDAFSQIGSRFKLKYWVTPMIDCGEI